VNNAPKYAVSHGKTQVISPSDMGFLLKNNEDLSQNFEILKVENLLLMKLGTKFGEKRKNKKPLQSNGGKTSTKKSK
jgi:alpha-glucosidase